VNANSTDPSPRRRPSTGGYARGEETRARVVGAALKVFGQAGYLGASTREIAREAGVTPPALQYYFDSKEGLHRACAEFVIEHSAQGITAALASAERVLDDSNARAAADAICDLLDALIDASLFSGGSANWEKFAARVQSEPETPAAMLIESQLTAPTRQACARLVACALGSPLTDEVRLRSIVILSQGLAFTLRRELALQGLGWPDFDGQRKRDIKAVLRAHTQAALKRSRV
jgi:AcrR family transcriptional regulator